MGARLSEKQKNLLLMFFSTLIIFFVLEFFFRLFSPQITEHDEMFQYDPVIGWKFIPNKKGNIVYYDEVQNVIETNAMGFRDDISQSLPNGKKVMVIGDSFVSNISVKDDAVFTEVMEEDVPNMEVLNFGVNGYGQVQERLVLKEWLPKVKPDVIIAMVYIRNDFVENMPGAKWLYPRPTVSWSSEQKALRYNPLKTTNRLSNEKSFWKFYKRIHLYQFVRKKMKNINNKWNREKANSLLPPELYLCRSDLSEETKEMYVVLEKMLLEIRHEAERAETPIIFSLAPSIAQVQDDQWNSLFIDRDEEPSNFKKSLPNDRLMKFAKENDLNMIDLLPALRKEAGKGKRLYNPLEQHWTAEGNKVVATSLLEYFKANAYLD